MPDCSTCEQFGATATGVVIPCPRGGRAVVLPGASAGEKQHPLLFLMYTFVTGIERRDARKVRATWRTPTIRASGAKYYPFYTFKQSVVEQEVSDLVGMLLAQRVRTLPLWSLLRRGEQEALGRQINDLLYAGDDVIDPSQPIPVESLIAQFEGVARAGERTLAARGIIERIRARVVVLQRDLADANAARARVESEVRAQIESLRQKHDEGLRQRAERLAMRERERRAQIHLETAQRDRLVAQRNALGEQGRLGNARLRALEAAFAATGDPAARQQINAEGDATAARLREMEAEDARLSQQIAGYNGELENLARQTPEKLARDYDDELAHLATQARRIEQESLAELVRLAPTRIDAELRHCAELSAAWVQRAEAHRLEDVASAERTRHEILTHAVAQDFALQLENYAPSDRGMVQVLRAALEATPQARQIFLALHPRFKYGWTAPTLCRMAKLLGDGEFLSTWTELHEAGLLAPGVHARLGVMVMNALRAGSYDQRHREMVQSELDGLVTAMREYGVGDAITCHSCGAARFGDPSRSGWIRDHNPPTAFVKLQNDKGIDLGLPRYQKTASNVGRQILLPQCMRCSTAQSSIASRAATELESLHVAGTLHGADAANTRRLLRAKLSGDEWAQLCRLVLNPGIGWSVEGQAGAPQAVAFDVHGAAQVTPLAFVDPALVTSGGPGSFAALDETALDALGNLHGCHTCIDTPQQTDAYRGVSWIADHQPPTALVARGLAELPQIVYPHCHACSKRQSQLVRKLAGLFDGCFGVGWSDQWANEILGAGYNDV
jgi:hypothetical protein